MNPRAEGPSGSLRSKIIVSNNNLGKEDLAPPPVEALAQAVAPFEVFGDGSYGTADLVEKMEAAGIVANVKVQPPAAVEGRFSKDAFHVDLEAQTVKCPADKLARIRTLPAGGGIASFGIACNNCPLRDRCTNNKEGRPSELGVALLGRRPGGHLTTRRWDRLGELGIDAALGIGPA